MFDDAGFGSVFEGSNLFSGGSLFGGGLGGDARQLTAAVTPFLALILALIIPVLM